MNRNPKGRALAIAACVVALGAALAGAHAQSAPAQASQAPAAAEAPKPKMAEEVFKNIQVLKGVPAEQWLPTMQFMATSLGVECEYCHVAEKEKDDKKNKLTARKMIEMMAAINKNNFDGQRKVTCYSCHHGGAEPSPTPNVAGEDWRPEPRREQAAGGGEAAAA